MTDVYKLIANMICNSINGKWDKAIVEIEGNRILSRKNAINQCLLFL